MNRRALLRTLPLCALPFLLCNAGCLIGSESHTHSEGRRISQETLDRVRPGHSRDYVLALLGEPTTRTPVEDGHQVWKWQYRTVKQSEGAIFLLAASDTRTEEAGAVYVEFVGEAVSKTWRD